VPVLGGVASADTWIVAGDSQVPAKRADDRIVPISGNRGMPGWRAFLVLGMVAISGYALLPGDPRWQAPGYALIATAGILAAARAVAFYRPQQPATWHTFLAGLVVWLISTVINRVTHDPPWSVVSDVLSLAGYPLMCLALIGLIRGRARAHDRTALIDAGIVATSLILLCWVFMVGTILTDRDTAPSEKLVTITLAGGDIALFVLGSLLLTTPGARTTSYRLLVAALLLTALSDILAVAEDTVGPHSDILGLLANTLAATAALHPSMRRLTVPLSEPPVFVRPRLVLLTATIVLAPAVSIYQGFTGRAGEHWLAVSVSSIVLFLLVGARMAGLVRRIEAQSRTLARLARHDALTGLPNRRQWDERLSAAITEHTATGEPLFVALIDLDRFKLFNDTHGHQAGDELLASAAETWRRHLRDGDLLARYGGEEFGLLVTSGTEDEAAGMLERLMAATPHGQTFSAGLARWDGRAGPEQLLQDADRLLYLSKNTGRARITTGQTQPQDQIQMPA
jgi:diguanylate cyclase (GGDEF)-like protein